MTADSFYRRAAFLPVIVPAAAAGLAAMSEVLAVGPAAKWTVISSALLFVALAGAFSLVPYGVFIAAIVVLRQPRGAREYRRLCWMGPSMIALPFAMVCTLIFRPQGGVAGAVQSFATWGLFALVVGYAYAAVIEAGFQLASLKGWITAVADAE